MVHLPKNSSQFPRFDENASNVETDKTMVSLVKVEQLSGTTITSVDHPFVENVPNFEDD